MSKCKSLIGGGGGCDDNPSIWAMVGATPEGYKDFKEFLTKDLPAKHKLHDTPTIREYRLVELHFSAADADIISEEMNGFIWWDYVSQRFPKKIKWAIELLLKKAGICSPLKYPKNKKRRAVHKCNGLIFVPLGYRGEQIGDDFFE